MLPDWTLAPVVAVLQTMCGMALVNAATLIAELGDLSRFANPRQLMAYLGLVPCEHSSGASVRRGGITKAGNNAARRLLIEAVLDLPLPGPGQPRLVGPAGEPAQADPRDRLEGAALLMRALSQAHPHRQTGQCGHRRDRP
jgi:transposase